MRVILSLFFFLALLFPWGFRLDKKQVACCYIYIYIIHKKKKKKTWVISTTREVRCHVKRSLHLHTQIYTFIMCAHTMTRSRADTNLAKGTLSLWWRRREAPHFFFFLSFLDGISFLSRLRVLRRALHLCVSLLIWTHNLCQSFHIFFVLFFFYMLYPQRWALNLSKIIVYGTRVLHFLVCIIYFSFNCYHKIN